MSSEKIESGKFQSKDGTQLYYRHFPNSDAEVTLLFVHGYGEHCERYTHVLEWFHGKGYNVATFDYRGHGKAAGRRGHVRRYSDYIADLDAFIELMMDRLDTGGRVYLVGHSNGGLVVVNYVLHQPEGIDGIVLSSPMLGFKLKIPRWKSVLGKAMSRLWPSLSLPSEIPASHLSHDADVVRAYDADPLVNSNATARWFTEAQEAQHNVLVNAHKLQLPVLAMQAGDDMIVNPDTTQNFVAALGSNDKELKWYDGLYHELFNEVDNEDVFTDVDAWLQQHD